MSLLRDLWGGAAGGDGDGGTDGGALEKGCELCKSGGKGRGRSRSS